MKLNEGGFITEHSSILYEADYYLHQLEFKKQLKAAS